MLETEIRDLLKVMCEVLLEKDIPMTASLKETMLELERIKDNVIKEKLKC